MTPDPMLDKDFSRGFYLGLSGAAWSWAETDADDATVQRKRAGFDAGQMLAAEIEEIPNG